MTLATKSTSITKRATLFKSTLGYCANLALAGSIALAVLGFGASTASAHDGPAEVEPIVGLWEITVSYGSTVIDNVFAGWTSDGLEFDQDIAAILSGYVCYGTWIKLKGQTYGLSHPFFDFVPSTGIWDGTSGYLNYTVTVSKDGKTFTGKENGKFGVPGPNPYTGAGGTPFSGLALSATKIEVDKSLLP
jgi:hypothetical protein